MNILLNYFFPITTITPTQAASSAFLKQALALVKPADGVTPGTITECTTSAEISALTDNTEVVQLLTAGMSKVYVLPMASLDIDEAIAGTESDYFSLLISSDFSQGEIDSADFGLFKGVIACADTDDTWLATWSATANRCGFHTNSTNKSANMFYAFGSLLSNSLNWLNQQYITMPLADDVSTVGDAESLFDDKISFIINDTEYGKRLALFACGGQAIVAPYIKRNLELDMQSAALSFVSGNQPGYTKKNAALLEDELKKVIDLYISREWIESGTVAVSIESDNFTASGDINISEPKALWRIVGEIRQTL
jgi:hypothetical protein